MELKSYRRIPSIADYVYDTLPIPSSIADGQALLEQLKQEIGSICTQIAQQKCAMFSMNEKEQRDFQEWKKKAISARFAKEQQIRLLKMWLSDNSTNEPRIAGLLDREELKVLAVSVSLYLYAQAGYPHGKTYAGYVHWRGVEMMLPFQEIMGDIAQWRD